VKVLETEKDVALRDRAHESLVAVTGKHLPPDAKQWDALLHDNSKPQSPPNGLSKTWNTLVSWWH
jgi:hypothetical protein